MKALVICAALAISTTSASAVERYQSTGLSCAAIKASIKKQGSIILHFASNNADAPVRYDRFVGSANQCDTGSSVAASSVTTRDDPNCAVQSCQAIRNHHG